MHISILLTSAKSKIKKCHHWRHKVSGCFQNGNNHDEQTGYCKKCNNQFAMGCLTEFIGYCLGASGICRVLKSRSESILLSRRSRCGCHFVRRSSQNGKDKEKNKSCTSTIFNVIIRKRM